MRQICFYLLISLMLFAFSSAAISQFGASVPNYPQEMDGMVNMITRVPYFSETDLAVPGRGGGINFTRTYNGDSIYRSNRGASYLGPRWSHTYQWKISFPRWKIVILSGSGSQHSYPLTIAPNRHNWANGATFRGSTGERGRLSFEKTDTTKAYIYTTRHGVRYRFEIVSLLRPDHTKPTKIWMLTRISDPNGNDVTLHYEAVRDGGIHRLAAVEDAHGRILKFSYHDIRAYNQPFLRYISKIEYGLGTPQALTTVYQTVNYSYTGTHSYRHLTSVTHQLGTGDPRGASLETQYEYRGSSGSVYDDISAIETPLGYRTEFDYYYRNWHDKRVTKMRVEDVPSAGATDGTVLYVRQYTAPSKSSTDAYSTQLDGSLVNGKRYLRYSSNAGRVVTLYHRYPTAATNYAGYWSFRGSHSWKYARGNVSQVHFFKSGRTQAERKNKWMYKIYYGSAYKHNDKMGNATKWEQIDTTNGSVFRKWTADYETNFNRPIWQIDSMGHKTTFTYDSKGNLTEQRSKANTGTQPHAVGHDIITKHAYDSYGNRTKTTFMPGTSQEKVVTTVYDSTKHAYPIEVKTTVTVNGADHTIKTKSEWDVNRGLKTADIDAAGRRTEYAYWKDRKLKYTRRVADNMYTIPTYDKNGNVTQTQVRKGNWQTGTLIAQTKTEYDAMNRVVKVHSFNGNNWTTPYATTETVYDIFGDVSETKDPRGLKTTYTRDELGRVTKQALPDGDWVETRYNTLNQVTKAWTSANGTETSPAVSNTYDNLNRLSQVSYKTGESVSYTYDLGDNVLTQQTNDGANTYTYTFTHDQLNRIKNRTDSLLGYKTFYEYDDSSMRTRMYVNPTTGSTTTKLYDVQYTYDEANRLLTVKDVLANKTESYGYFDIGALKKITVPNGITAHRTLDNINRLSALTYKKDASTTLSSLTYTYDDKSNVTQLVRDDTGAGGSSKTFTFGYDGISRLTSANYGDETVSYTYDKSGNRLTQVSSVDGTTTYTVATNSNQLTYRSLVPEDTDFSTMNYTYDAEGKLTQRNEGTDSDAFSYGFGSQLKQIQKTRNNTVTQTLTYAYDGGGKRVKVTDSQGTRYFLYDGLMPVLELDSSKNITASYLYGGNGVVYRRKHTAVAHWHFDEGTGTVAHDLDGSQNGTLGDGDANKRPTWNIDGSLLFDGTNDVLKVSDSDALDLVGNTLTISCWVKRSAAASGYLVKKADTSNGYRLWITSSGAVQFEVLFSGTTKTVTSATTIPLNTWKHVAARYDGSELRVFIGGTIETATTAATGSLAATTEALWLGYYDGTSHHLNGYLDDVSIYDTALSDAEITKLSNNQMGRYEYHHTNALGSNIVLTDDNKNVLVRYEYDVFGAVRSEVGTSDNTRKFTGKEYESDVKLYYFAARYYDPYIGRFTQRDPAGQGGNWYAYGANNPMRFIDPTGMYIVLPGGTEIRSVPGTDADGNYIRPGGLTDDGGLVWDAIFTGGINGTGIAGSGAAGGILTDIIESDVQVNIKFDKDLASDANTDPTDFHNSGITVNVKNTPNPQFVGQLIRLTTDLVHEFSHVHNFIMYPSVFLHGSSSYDKDFYLYVM